jgi:phage terminase small subunit
LSNEKRITRRSRLSTRRALENSDLATVEKSLTARQRRFCYEYVKDFNKRAAVIRAGYVTEYPDRQATNLFKNEGIVALIEELKTKNSFEITAVDPNYVVQGIVQITSNPEAKDADKLRGFELLAKHLGMLTDKQEITGKDGGPLSVAREEAEQEAAEIIGLLRGLHARAEKDKQEKKDNVVELKRA